MTYEILDIMAENQISTNGDILRDCRKSQIMAILAISHVMKSTTYMHQIHRFRVFRQSLEISQVSELISFTTPVPKNLHVLP